MYLKKVEERGALVPIPTDLELGDEYFSFADSINAAAAKHSAPAASLEAPTAAHLRATAHAIGVPLGWLDGHRRHAPLRAQTRSKRRKVSIGAGEAVHWSGSMRMIPN